MLNRASNHEALDPSVHIAEPFLQADDRLAAGSEAEMAGLDNAGVHGSDRDLVQIGTLGRKKAIDRRAVRSSWLVRQGMMHTSSARDRAKVGGPASPERLKSDEILDGTLQPNGRRVQVTNRRKNLLRTRQAENNDAI